MSTPFRKKSLATLEQVEEIDAYVRTVRIPSILLLACAALLAAGLVVWSLFGQIENTGTALVVCDTDGYAVCYVPESVCAQMDANTAIRVNDTVCSVSAEAGLPVPADTVLSEYECHAAGFSQGIWVYTLAVDADLSPGVYPAKVYFGSVSPLSLVFG